MSDIERLLNNINKLLAVDCNEGINLNLQLNIMAKENPDLDSISKLNDLLEAEISYMAESC